MGKAARNRAKRRNDDGVKSTPIDFQLQNLWNQQVVQMGNAAEEFKEKNKGKK